MTEPEPLEAETLTLPIVWGELARLPVYAANQFMLQLSQPGSHGFEEIVLTVGYAAPPAITGSTEEQKKKFAELQSEPPSVEVRPLVRITMTPTRAGELRDLLVRVLEKADDSRPPHGGQEVNDGS